MIRALFERAEDGSLLIVDSLDIAPAKTSVANSVIRGIAPEGNLLIVDESFSDTSMLAIRNLRGVVLEEAAIVSVTDLCDFAKIIITRKGMDVLVERAKGGSK